MAFERFFLVNEKYGSGFVVQEYAGRWYVQEAYRSKEGNIGKKFMSKYKGKGHFLCKDDGEPYIFPVGVEITEEAAKNILGNKEDDDIF